MPSIRRSRSLTMSFYTNLAINYDKLTGDGRSSSEARKTCREEFEVSAQTVSDALLFLKFPRPRNESVYALYEQNFFSTSTLIFILKAAKRSNKTTDQVINCLFDRYQLQELKKLGKTGSKRGGIFPLSQTDVENWMKDTIPRIR